MVYNTSKNTSTGKITETVKKNGLCIIPDYLSTEQLLKLNLEFNEIIDRTYNGGFYEHGCRGYMDAIAVSESELRTSPFKAHIDLISTPQLSNIMREFYLEDDFYIQHIFDVKSTETPLQSVELPYSLHFDKIHMLKFFFLLSDTNEDCGPTWVVPGQQHVSYKIRKEWKENGQSIQAVDNILNYPDNQLIPLTGKAGSLVILDTDIPHKAGIVAPTRKREVIRISAVSPSYAGIDLRAQT